MFDYSLSRQETGEMNPSGALHHRRLSTQQEPPPPPIERGGREWKEKVE